jgi:hypothetical protein
MSAKCSFEAARQQFHRQMTIQEEQWMFQQQHIPRNNIQLLFPASSLCFQESSHHQQLASSLLQPG